MILISNDRTLASKKINGMALIRTLTVSTTTFERMKEIFYGFLQIEKKTRLPIPVVSLSPNCNELYRAEVANKIDLLPRDAASQCLNGSIIKCEIFLDPSTEKQSFYFPTQAVFSLIPEDMNEIHEKTSKQMQAKLYYIAMAIIQVSIGK